jgi:hypothetical protein
MCFAVYLASRRPLPPIPWNKASPAFYLQQQSPYAAGKGPFSLPHVYYAGSHEGCGCGFIKDGHDDDLPVRQANYAALAALVRAEVSAGGNLELFACWEGDQHDAPKRTGWLTPLELEDPGFAFEELDFFCFVPDSA